jgi:dTDP-4-amino-4,6-dideoxygalactose transaminase
MINVTKTFLPEKNEYLKILDRAWDKSWITNNGELVQELEQALKNYLGVKHLFFCTNGTVVLQMALKALNITGEVITTPFSYVATTSAILWENCTPVFADINDSDYNIDVSKIENLITSKTQAILATHVYGNPCNINKIEAIAKKHQLKVIYDGAHAFGSEYNGKALLSFGDIATCSFHATKLFHTVEGGAIITNDDDIARKLMLFRQFGHVYDDYFSLGINAKNSEFHAAMGLAVLPHLSKIIDNRKAISEIYKNKLDFLKFPIAIENAIYNFSYFPIIFKSESDCLNIKSQLEIAGFSSRRYFYPSLNTLDYLPSYQACEVSESIAKRVLCLPLYSDLEHEHVYKICEIIQTILR